MPRGCRPWPGFHDEVRILMQVFAGEPGMCMDVARTLRERGADHGARRFEEAWAQLYLEDMTCSA